MCIAAIHMDWTDPRYPRNLTIKLTVSFVVTSQLCNWRQCQIFHYSICSALLDMYVTWCTRCIQLPAFDYSMCTLEPTSTLLRRHQHQDTQRTLTYHVLCIHHCHSLDSQPKLCLRI